ncbi:DNA-3-methyladenine glycosylase 2 family protein [Salinibacillus xinjiangensis]|uniref:DNA-3-methyladenine glycosylase II n=2 Tax=Salinibacillus xinjiangensis TaxID=1229268 RepID=A0A6G1X9B0_9BACI|nr:DNA-3-methyladenine glycosylase 2 family protein [Salinibacillus xinjiangensis]
MWTETIRAIGPFDFDYALFRLSFDPLMDLDRDGRWVRVPFKIGDDKHIVKVKATGSTEQPEFQISGDSDQDKSQLIREVEEVFQLHLDLKQIHNHFSDTKLAPLFAKYPGTPVVKEFNRFDALMKTIVHQQLNMKFAYTLSMRYVQNFGEEVEGVWFQPTPEKVASLNYEELRKLQFSQRKAEYVIDTSRMIVDGKLNLDELAEKPNEEVIETLTKVRGIGFWTAENWLLSGLGRDNLLPAADIGIQNALKKFLNLDSKPKKDDIYTMGEEWSPYRSYAAITLWRSIE